MISKDNDKKHEKKDILPSSESVPSKNTEQDLIEKLTGGKAKYVRFVLAALSSLPWIGSVLGAAASISSERDQGKVNELHKLWLQEHQGKANELAETLQTIINRLDSFGDEIQGRIESDEYLSLVRSTFRSWDQADTNEKRTMLSKLLTNAGAIKLCPDDLIRLFIKWIDQYHEAHFLVIREIYKNPGTTRGQIWDNIHDARPAENSAKADLFRYLIRELSTGGVIRQERQTTAQGEFMKRTPQKRSPRGSSSKTMESAFEDTKPYVLTELGKQFVHYVMEDVVPQISQT